MKRIKLIVILVNLVLLFGYFGWTVVAKEKTLKEGRLVLLELAPVDPRSLMQGDYLRLNYAISNVSESKNLSKRGYCIVRADTNGVSRGVRFQKQLLPLGTGEQAVKYFSNGNLNFLQLHIGAETYFFEEGGGKKYEQAKYGGLKVDPAGNSILVGLYKADRKLIQ